MQRSATATLVLAALLLVAGVQSRAAAAQTVDLAVADALDATADFDRFGAALATTGPWLAVGVPADRRVDIYRRVAGVWTQTQSVGGDYGARFGASLAMDGTRLVVASRTGAFVFHRSGGLYSYEATLETATILESLKRGVDIDGSTVLVGKPGSAGGNARVRVYVRSGGTWSIDQTLLPEVAAAENHFGTSVAIDGDLLAVGNRGQLVQSLGTPGYVQFYGRSGGAWVPTQLVTASQPGVWDQFGSTMAAADGRLAVGAPRINRVFVYERDANGAWMDMGVVAGSNNDFGRAVALTGRYLLVGADSYAQLRYRAGGDWLVVARRELTGMHRDSVGESVAIAGDEYLSGGSIGWGTDGSRGRVEVLQRPCSSVSFSKASMTLNPSGAAKSVSVQASPKGCGWALSDDSGWLMLSRGWGTGNKSLVVTATVNVSGDRTGTVFAQPWGGLPTDQLTVNQASLVNVCSNVTLSRYSAMVGPGATDFVVDVNAIGASCGWVAIANESWLSLSPDSGSGDGTVEITVAAHTTGGTRVGTVTIGNKTVTVTQGPALQCGATLSSDTLLDEDLDCTGLAAEEAGLTLEEGVTLDLNGHDILGPGAFVDGAIGVLLPGTGGAVIDGRRGETPGAIRNFSFATAAVVPEGFPCPSFASLADGSCFGGPSPVARRAAASANTAALEVERVQFFDNNFSAFALSSSLSVKDSRFENNTEGVTFFGDGSGSPAPVVTVRTSTFLRNYIGVDVEEGVAVTLTNNVFRENAGSGVLLVRAGSTAVVDNAFVRNNSDTDEGKFLGQVTIEPSASMRIQCNRFVDSGYEGSSALDLDGVGSPRPGHGSIGIGGETDGAEVLILENDFDSGDVAVFFWEPAGAGDFEVTDNNFGAGLSFNVGIHDGFPSTRTLHGASNHLVNANPLVSDPSGGAGFASDTTTAGGGLNACSLRTPRR